MASLAKVVHADGPGPVLLDDIEDAIPYDFLDFRELELLSDAPFESLYK